MRARLSEDRGRSSALQQLQQSAQPTDDSWKRGLLHSMQVGSIRARVSEDGGRSSEDDSADSKHQARSLARTILRDAIGEGGRHERLRKDAVDGFKRLRGSLHTVRY